MAAKEFENLHGMVDFINRSRLSCDEFKFSPPSGESAAKFALLYWDHPKSDEQHARDFKESAGG